MIRYVSTNGGVAPVDLPGALLQGQAADGGLFMPDRLPGLDSDIFDGAADRGYAEVAHRVLRPFTEGLFTDSDLARMCADAYDFEVPLEQIIDRAFVMRLDRGPTASFKDFAARMMARWFAALMRSEPGELIVLTATSGDTGGAVAHAFYGMERIRVVVLFPVTEVSDRQRRQMTTLGGNVTAMGVEGKFDDCQAMVKRAFSDESLAGLKLTSANSINIGRLLPQAVYYVYAYLRLAEAARREPIIFAVPSGNFGDMMGAMLAWRMGLPVRRLIIATNANDAFPQFLATGRYEKITPSRVCLSNAMNVGHPSNLARLLHLYGGWMDQSGAVRREPDLGGMRRDLYAIRIDDDATRATIRQAHSDYGVTLEPHGAVAWAGVEAYLRDYPDDRATLMVSLETAHPAKFPEEIQRLIGVDPQAPTGLADLDRRTESFDTLSVDYGTFHDCVLAAAQGH